MSGFADDIVNSIMRYMAQFVVNIAGAFLRLFGRRPKPKKGHARADFAAKNPPVNRQVISSTPRGVFFGTRGNQYIIKHEDIDGHVLVVGTPGSGKSSCIAIPTLQHWKNAVFAVDIKGELKGY